MVYKNGAKNFVKNFRLADKNWRDSRNLSPRKIFAREPLAKLRSNFASVGVWILLKESSDIVQQTPRVFLCGDKNMAKPWVRSSVSYTSASSCPPTNFFKYIKTTMYMWL